MQDAKLVGPTLWNKQQAIWEPMSKNKSEKVEMNNCTKLDIAYVVGVVSRFIGNLGKEHWVAVKWIVRYMRGTSSICPISFK